MKRVLLRRLLGEAMATAEPLPLGVQVRRCRWITALGGRLSGMRKPAAAVTLGPLILVHPAAKLTERLLRHELAHVEQWRRRPVAFPVLYLLGHLRYGYAANPFEIEARQAERIDKYPVRKDTTL